MNAWTGWDVDRAVLVFTAVAYVAIWVQVSLYHWAGGFKHVAMWGPVLATPLVIAGALAGAAERQSPWGWVAAALLAFGVLDGLIGVYYHFRGIASQIGGFTTRNVLSGPPPMLPVAYAAVGVLGLGALLWHA